MSDTATTWTTAYQASLSITNPQSLPKLMSIELVIPFNYLILCRPLLLLPSIFPSIRIFSNESALRIRWPKYWSLSFNISPSNEHPRLISFRMDWWISLQSKVLYALVLQISYTYYLLWSLHHCEAVCLFLYPFCRWVDYGSEGWRNFICYVVCGRPGRVSSYLYSCVEQTKEISSLCGLVIAFCLQISWSDAHISLRFVSTLHGLS